MLAYDKKQIGRIHRILIPAVIFTAAVLLGRMDTIMADFGQSEPLAAGKALSFAFESLTTGFLGYSRCSCQNIIHYLPSLISSSWLIVKCSYHKIPPPRLP